MDVARWLLLLVGAYAAAGVLFAVPFLFLGIRRVDPAAHGAGWGFRILILPGLVALWPVMARRWARALRSRS